MRTDHDHDVGARGDEHIEDVAAHEQHGPHLVNPLAGTCNMKRVGLHRASLLQSVVRRPT